MHMPQLLLALRRPAFLSVPFHSGYFSKDSWVLARWRATGRDAENVPGSVQPALAKATDPGDALPNHSTRGSLHRTILVSASGVELVAIVLHYIRLDRLGPVGTGSSPRSATCRAMAAIYLTRRV